MDIFDFDGTLYRGDSSVDFLLFCIKAQPKVLVTLPKTIVFGLLMLTRRIDKTSFKRVLYRFIYKLDNTQKLVELFWQEHEAKIQGPCNPKQGDLVISASPEFLLKDICAKRGLLLIASPVNPQTGEVLGPNCSNEEKVRRLFEKYPDARINKFYSDSRNDDPLAALAQEAYLVKNGSLQAWPR